VSARVELGGFLRLAPGIRGPEGVAVDRAGNVYGGGADGVIRRLSPDGTLSELAKVSDGQLGGLAFDRDDNLFVCDGFTGRVVKVTPRGHVSVFAEFAGSARLHVPNFPVFDEGGDLWVSNSFDRPLSEIDFAAEHREPRPAGTLVRLRPEGSGEVVCDGMFMPNGLAIDPGERWIYVLQTTLQNCVRLPLDAPGGEPEPYGPSLGGGPDGMAFDAEGDLVITMPGERRLVVLGRDGSLRTLAEDPDGETLPFPTNCAFAGPDFQDLHVANMHADHLPTIRMDRPGHPLFNRRRG
jgi:sugar lactone lactonase YvrE